MNALRNRGAERSIQTIAEAHHQYGWVLTSQGREDDGLVEFIRASELDPLSPWLAADLAELIVPDDATLKAFGASLADEGGLLWLAGVYGSWQPEPSHWRRTFTSGAGGSHPS